MCDEGTGGRATDTGDGVDPIDPIDPAADLGSGVVLDAGVPADRWDPDAVQIGWSKVDITPALDPPVQMRGRYNGEPIFASGVMDPITATAMAIESPLHPDESVVLVSADLIRIPDGVRNPEIDLVGAVRDRVAAKHPEIPTDRIVLMATHTHVAPYISADVVPFYADRMAEAVIEAWNGRGPSAVSYGLGHAVAGHNRIVSHHDGSAHMIGSEQGGSPSAEAFSHMEGFEDHSVHLLYTFDSSQQLTGVVVNITCPAQVQRGRELTDEDGNDYFFVEISADFWHEVRTELEARLAHPIQVLPQVSAAGEVATTAVIENAAEERMARLRYPELEDEDEDAEDWRTLRRRQIAHRIVETILDVRPYMDGVMEQTPHLGHEVQTVPLSHGCPEPDGTTYDVELHGIRVSDVAMITNPFELYLDYGSRIKGRSPAIQTFVVELAGSATYLPTRRAVAGGGYGSRPTECDVGPDGGDELVDASLSILESLWAE